MANSLSGFFNQHICFQTTVGFQSFSQLTTDLTLISLACRNKLGDTAFDIAVRKQLPEEVLALLRPTACLEERRWALGLRKVLRAAALVLLLSVLSLLATFLLLNSNQSLAEPVLPSYEDAFESEDVSLHGDEL